MLIVYKVPLLDSLNLDFFLLLPTLEINLLPLPNILNYLYSQVAVYCSIINTIMRNSGFFLFIV